METVDRIDTVTIEWDKPVAISRATPTLQVVAMPPLRRGSAIHDAAFEHLAALGASHVRFVPWLPYPRLSVAALEPPDAGNSARPTSWDFALIDPLVEDFMTAMNGRPAVVDFSTIPQWMFETQQRIAYPDDPNEVTWKYSQGPQLRDPTLNELAGYFERVAGWYLRGGFTDEAGALRQSGHAYSFDYWEVLNEPDIEHKMTPELYTACYDAIVAAVRRVRPEQKFIGASLAFPSKSPRFLEYFLNPLNHLAGTPIDGVSYHFYAVPARDQPFETQPWSYFAQAEGFCNTVRYVQEIRQRLSPGTITFVNEIGSIYDIEPAKLPAAYWNLSGAVYAYVFFELMKLGVEWVGQSQLLGYPSQFPSVSMLDWTTGQPNARWRVLKLLIDHCKPGDVLIETRTAGPNSAVVARAFRTAEGVAKVGLINRRLEPVRVQIEPPPAAKLCAEIVDQTTASGPAVMTEFHGNEVVLNGLAVAIITPISPAGNNIASGGGT